MGDIPRKVGLLHTRVGVTIEDMDFIPETNDGDREGNILYRCDSSINSKSDKAVIGNY
jgi:hypothetical protein